MKCPFVFNVYGILGDSQKIISKLKEIVGAKAEDFSLTWLEKQLEYSFCNGTKLNYESFDVCTRNALDYTCSYYNIQLTKEQKATLLNI